MDRGIHVFIGTKAQYIKTAPLLRLMDDKGVEYRLIDSGQHAEIASLMRSELGVREPDYVFGGDRDIATVPQAVVWSARIAARLWSGRRLRREVFAGRGGICVVHGDTPSTLLSCLIAMRAGLRVAHMETGLRSGKLTHPFPEEIIRHIVMRLADLCFAPTPDAARYLDSIRKRGRTIPLDGNTSLEALRYALETGRNTATGPAMVTMHRVENLRSRERVELFAETVLRIAQDHPVHFVVHEPTRHAIGKFGVEARLATAAGVTMTPLLAHNEFVAKLREAPFAITDGGSIQEECAMIGLPTLLWRDRTEWEFGLDANVVLSHYDRAAIDAFLADPGRLRRPPSVPTVQPSVQILDELLAELDRPAR
jgi:UDP-N-acetylglucosamine 2-epimerase